MGAVFFWGVLFSIFANEVYLYSTLYNKGIFETLQIFGVTSQKALLVFGIFSPLFFALLYILRPLVFFPASIMTISSVLIFGPYLGFLVSYLGEACSAILTFTIGKYFGKELGITNKVTNTTIHTYLQKNAFLSIFLLRIIPLFPFDFVNYSSGVLRVKFKTYMTATLLGIMPGLLVFIFLGNSLYRTEQMPYAISAAVLLIITGWLLKQKYQIKESA
jgi:uncharacterized membrane protein YdjX (TVP38/TMEM64 family)